jgi:DNA helicase-2/ATP-dependent DNA helicase PcrA
MRYLEDLNSAQREAVLATKGPLLVVAGAGAGKTKTLTYRVVHLVRNGVMPCKILALTFTNKAAREMRERVEIFLKRNAGINFPISVLERPFMGTFHALGARIIRENSKNMGLPRNFTIFDRNDSIRAVKQAMREAGLDLKQFEPPKLLAGISRKKGDNITLARFKEGTKTYFERTLASVWQHYEAILQRAQALDFDDLLLRTAELLEHNSKARAYYQSLWDYIHVDEYQDTNRVQYEIVRTIAAKHRNICVVGDTDQTIYSWRGADVRNILEFENDYPDSRIVLLEENYRSTKTILAAANSVIQKNTLRKEKTLFTNNATGEKIGLHVARDEQGEAKFVIEKISSLLNNGISPRKIAVLYRTNFQSRVLEEAFLFAGIPYQVVGVRFFERKEIKDILAFIRAARNPKSFTDIQRIINIPPRGIGKVTLLKLFTNRKHELADAMQKRVDDFYALLRRIRTEAKKQKPSGLIKFVLRHSGVEKMLSGGSEDEKERLENIWELATLAVKYDTLPPEKGIEQFLEDAALASDQDTLINDEHAVKLMTVHASKGLEFDYVFITGLEQELFPHIKDDTVGVLESEEERRLFYVALTRARKKINLSCASTRTIFGSRQINQLSEFIADIDEDLIEIDSKPRESFEDETRVIYVE